MESEPAWILETQRMTLAGKWAPTTPRRELLPSCLLWLGLKGTSKGDPPAFVPFRHLDVAAKPLESDMRISAKRRMSRLIGRETQGDSFEHLSIEDLRSLLYADSSREDATYFKFVDESTDAAGWIYATSAHRLSRPRFGGRAGRRAGDRYRRRWWHHHKERGGNLLQELDDDQVEQDNRHALSSFFDAAMYALRQSQVCGLPLDPIAAFRRGAKDKQRYADLCARLPMYHRTALLGPLCMAAVYARAVYGLLSRMGFVDSLSQGARVFSVQRLVFDLSVQVDDASNLRAFLDMTGLDAEDIVCARWKTAGPFSPVYVVARDHAMRWIVVAVRGTIAMKDIWTDLAANPVPFLDGMGHEGFVLMADRLIGSLREVLSREAERFPGYCVVFCGHSMGAGVAALAAMKFRQEAACMRCFSFGIGTPAIVSRSMSERVERERSVFTVINGRDWAPRVSLLSTLEIGEDIVQLGMLRSGLRVATGSQPRPPRVADEHEQVPPGVMLQICPPTSQAEVPKLLLGSPTDYRYDMQVWPRADAHLPLAYIEGLLKIFLAKLDRHVADSAGSNHWDLVNNHLGSDSKGLHLGLGDNSEICQCYWNLPEEAQAASSTGNATGALCGCTASALAALRRTSFGQDFWQGADAALPAWPDRARQLITEHLHGLM